MTLVNKTLDILFYIFITLTFGLAAVIVIGQVVSIVTLSGDMALYFKKLIVLNARFGAGVSIITLIMGYLRGWMSSKKKVAKGGE
jgi:hypothetical protein